MANDLTVYKPQSNDLINNMDDAFRLAEMVAKSRMFKDAEDAGKAMMKILAGREMGFTPMQSLRGIHVFDGKVEMGAGLLAAKIKASQKYDYQVVRSDDKGTELQWFEGGNPVGTSSFTMDDAKRAGLAGKSNWMKFPGDMCFARALTQGQRRYCPDVALGSVYAEGEISESAPAFSPAPAVQKVENYIDAEIPIEELEPVEDPEIRERIIKELVGMAMEAEMSDERWAAEEAKFVGLSNKELQNKAIAWRNALERKLAEQRAKAEAAA